MIRRIASTIAHTPLFWLMVPLCAFYAVIFSQKWIPTHDSQVLARMIQILVGHFSATGEYPLWLPFMSQGIPSNIYHFSQLQPSVHFLTPWVRSLEAWNSITLYYMALFIDELIFLGGVFALARALYQRMGTALFIAISLTGSVITARQPYFNFGNVYYLPLCCYFIVSGFKSQKLFRIGIGWLIFFTMAGRGYGVYPSILSGLTLGLFTLMFGLTHRLEVAPMLRKFGKRELFVLALFIIPVTLSVLLQKYGVSPSIISPARDSTGAADYSTFLNYGWTTELLSFTEMALGVVAKPATIEYAGIAILPFLLIALIFPAGKQLFPFLGCSIFLFLFWMGRNSFVAPLLYFVPPVSLYRHVGHIGAILKLFLVFTAGFGFETFLNWLREKDRAELKPLVTLSLGIFVALFTWDLFLYNSLMAETATEKLRIVIFTGIIVLHLNILLSGSLKPWIVPILLGFAMVDVYSFRFSLYHQELLHVSPELWSLFRAKKMEYDPVRSNDYYRHPNFVTYSAYAESENNFSVNTLQSCLSDGKDCNQPKGKIIGELYDDLEQFLGFDPCLSIFRSEVSMPRVAEVQKSFGIQLGIHYPLGQYENPKLRKQVRSQAFQQTMGCEVPKLQLRNTLTTFPNETELMKALTAENFQPSLMAKEGDLLNYKLQKLSLKPSTLSFDHESTTPAVGNVTVSRFNFNRLDLVTNARSTSGSSWLYYADAAHPFWKAFVNGQEVPILTANHAYKAVQVPNGPARVTFQFSSPVTQWILISNAWLCFVAVGLILSWVAWGIRFERMLHRFLLLLAGKDHGVPPTQTPDDKLLAPQQS